MAPDIMHKLAGLNNIPPINEITGRNFFETCLIYIQKHWKTPKFIISCLAISTTFYIFNPISSIISLFKSNKEQSIPKAKRPDKYTTGFTNTANDCFANSTVQSFVPLYRLTEYLHQLLKYNLPPEAIKYSMPLHLSLFGLLEKLQRPVYSNFSISVWDLLHLLESIHQGKISRSQHDAHELFQLLIDTLYEEYNRFFSFFNKLSDDRKKEVESIPKFPFFAIVETKLQCMNCKCFSRPVKTPMMILELIVPQNNTSISLDTILKNNNNEIIEGYACFICMIKNIIFRMSNLSLTPEQSDFIENVKSKLILGALTINDDLREDLIYKSILSQNEMKLNSSSLKSLIHKQNTFLEPPQILPIHLSRSMFMDAQVTKNSCNVSYNSVMEFKLSNGITINYRLRSLIRHKGIHSSGHYECYRIKPDFFKLNDGEYSNDIPKLIQDKLKKGKKKLASVLNKSFWRISDNSITEVTMEHVLNDGKGVYMLIYERI